MASDQIEICGNCKHYAKCKDLMNKKKFKKCLNDIEANSHQFNIA